MKCPKCSAELTEDSKVCPECGAELTGAQPGAEAGNQASEQETQPETAGETTAQSEAAGETTARSEAAGEAEAQPEAAEEAEAFKAPEAPVKKNNKKWLFGGIAAAVVVIGVAVAAFAGRKDPKTVVVDAFKSVYAQGQVTPIEEIFGLSEMLENSVKTDSQGSMSIKITGSSDPSIQAMAGSGITIEEHNDVANKKSDGTIGIQYNGMDFFNMVMYLDRSNIAIALPGVSSKVLTMDYANDLEGQVENSPYLGKMAKENGMDLTSVGDYINYVYKIYDKGSSDIFDIGGLWKRYKEGSKAIADLKAAMTVKKSEKKTLTVDGKEASCQGYEVQITKDAAVAFVKTTSQFFLEDESFKANFLEYFNQVFGLSQRLYGINIYTETPEQMQQELWTEFKNSMDEIVKGMEEDMGDINMSVYVDKAGRLASVDAKTTVADEDGTTVDLAFHADLKGGVYLTQNADAVLTISDAEDSVTISMAKTGAYDKKNLTSDIQVTMGNGVESYGFGYTGNYEVETKAYDMSVALMENETEMFNMKVQGVVNDLVKGKSFDMVFDTIDIEEDGQNIITLSGNYGIKPLETVVAMPSGEQMDMLAATEEEWTEVVNEIMNNVISLLFGASMQ